jgi:hypothetical protein
MAGFSYAPPGAGAAYLDMMGHRGPMSQEAFQPSEPLHTACTELVVVEVSKLDLNTRIATYMFVRWRTIQLIVGLKVIV